MGVHPAPTTAPFRTHYSKDHRWPAEMILPFAVRMAFPTLPGRGLKPAAIGAPVLFAAAVAMFVAISLSVPWHFSPRIPPDEPKQGTLPR